MGKRMTLFLVVLAGVMLLAVPTATALTIGLTSITPRAGSAGTSVECTIFGSFVTGAGADAPLFSLFQKGATTLNGSTTAWDTLAGTWARATFVLPTGAAPGAYDLRAVQSVGIPAPASYLATPLSGAFTVSAPAPLISSLSPTSVVAGSGDLTLQVNGDHFVNSTRFYAGSSVRWNGATLVTTYNWGKWLTAVVPAAMLSTPGTAAVTVRNVSDGTLSNAAIFTISGPLPLLTALSPTSLWAGYVKDDVVLTVTGGNFANGARIALNGSEKTATTFVSATQLTVPLVAADMASAGTLTVSVKNPPFPPGAPSVGGLPLAVQAETTDPTVSISGADSAWHNAPVALTFSATDAQSGVQKVQYMAPPTVGSWTDGTSYTVPTSAQGAITVSVQALDWCNKVGTASATVNIDTTKPKTATHGGETVQQGKGARLDYSASEPSNLSPKANVVIKIERNNGSTAQTIRKNNVAMNAKHTAYFTCNLAKGTYTWYVYATDLAGNSQANVAHAKLTVK
jgi:hypothetical protein